MSVPLDGLALVICVWGRRYLAEFFEVTLPSWLAPGNAPALAAAAGGRFDVMFMTGASDIEPSRTAPAILELERHARITWVPIDDLVAAPAYAVTLTLAFARAIALREQVAFGAPVAFLNADFILADGSLASLAATLAEGHRIVLAPSLRAGCRGPATGALRPLGAGQGGIARSYRARDLVRIALDDPHPTVLGAMVDQAALLSDHPNQLLWRIDGDALLCRSLLTFPLAVRPSRRIGVVAGYCDYDMAYRLAPGEAPAMLGDSDRYCALELAEPGQEAEILRLGPKGAAAVARSLSAWITPPLRAQGDIDVLHHAGPVDPAALAAARARADAFLAEIDRLLPAPAVREPHPYWRGGVAFWQERRRGLGLPDWAPELGARPAAPASRGDRARSVARRLLRGTPGARPWPWQPGYRTARLLRAALDAIGPARRLDDGTLAALVGPGAEGEGALACAVATTGLEALLPRLRPLATALPRGGRVLVLLRAPALEVVRPLDVARLLTLLPDCRATRLEIAAVAEEGAALRAERRLLLRLRQPGPARRLAAALALGAALLRLSLAQLRPGADPDAEAPAVLVTFERL